MNPTTLEILLQEGEGTLLEYKESLSASFARGLVALANTLGGKILLGVRDDGSIAGVGDSNELRARIQDIARNCDPPVKILLERAGKVTVVTVRESDAKPVQCSDGFFAAVFRPRVGEAQAEAQAEAQERLTLVEQAILGACLDRPQASQELLASMGHLTRSGNFKRSLLRLLSSGLIELTLPDKPRSPKQRYRITSLGHQVLEKS